MKDKKNIKQKKMYHSFTLNKHGWEFKLLEGGVKQTADFCSHTEPAPHLARSVSSFRTQSRSEIEISGNDSKRLADSFVI